MTKEELNAFRAVGRDGVIRDLDEHYDSMSDVVADPYGAWLAIQNLWTVNRDLLEALEPFADLLKPHHDGMADDHPIMGIEDSVFTAGDLRRARATIAKAKGEA